MSGVPLCAVQIVRPPEVESASEGKRLTATQREFVGAIPELHALYSRRLYRTIYAITKNGADAEDALQETFLRAHVGLRTFEGRSSVYSWLTRIAINSALMVLRKRRARAELSFEVQGEDGGEVFAHEVQDPAPTPEQRFQQRHREAILHEAVGRLDVRLREPIEMRLEKGSSVHEISVALQISSAATKTRLHRARVRLSAFCAKA